MKKFVVIYHTQADNRAQMEMSTPEQRAEGMKAWMDWAGRVGTKLNEMGAPLIGGHSIGTDGSVTKSTKDVTGYSVIEAESMDDAIKLMDGHPHINGWRPDATIEIHEVMPMPGM